MAVGSFFGGPDTSGIWAYASATPVTLTVTDLYVVSDAFDIYLDGGYLASTPLVPDWPAYAAAPFDPPWTADPDAALGSGVFSSGVFVLPAGAHFVSFLDYHIPPVAVGGPPFSDGTIAFKAVPEPATLSLLALAGLAVLRRRS
jgi:hypothetical protein